MKKILQFILDELFIYNYTLGLILGHGFLIVIYIILVYIVKLLYIFHLNIIGNIILSFFSLYILTILFLSILQSQIYTDLEKNKTEIWDDEESKERFTTMEGFSIVLNTMRDLKKIMFWFLQK